MRDFCVAVVAVVPLLLLVIAVETRLTATLMRRFLDSYVPWESYNLSPRITALAGIALFSAPAALLVEVAVLASIPFASSGSPESWWEWVVFIAALFTVAVLASLAMYGLMLTAEDDLEGPTDRGNQ